MKKIVFILSFIFIASCSSDKKEKKKVQEKKVQPLEFTDSTVVTDFLKDVKSIEPYLLLNGIQKFQRDAQGLAEAVATINQENMSNVLGIAEEFKFLVITVGTHTIVKITDLKDCKQSGSWQTCMSKAEGYVTKNKKFKYYNDYLNFIIGKPSDQEIKGYLFR